MIELGWVEEAPLAVITLNRPDRRNALDLQAVSDLAVAVDDAAASGARALLLRGAGGHLCSGADLATVEDPRFTPALQAALRAIAAAPMVVIAAMEGACMGAGVQLSVAADLRVAAPDARIAVPAAKLGLAVDLWTARRVAAALPAGEAANLLLASGELTGERAAALGLAQRLGGAEDAAAWALELCALAPLTIQAHKVALAAALGDASPHDAELARRRAWASNDLAEGKAAFADRRPPRFRGE